MANKLVHKHPLAIRWFHWINFPILLVMMWSGLLIYAANRVYRIGWGDVTLVRFFSDEFVKTFNLRYRLAEGMAWHFMFMWLFAVNGAIYVLYLIFSKEYMHLLPTKGSLRGALQVVVDDLRLKKHQPTAVKFNHAQRFAYTSVIFFGLVMLLTGLAIYKPTQLSWLVQLMGGYQVARFLHFWVTVLLGLFFVVHVLQVIRAGWGNFRAMITGHELVPVQEEVQGVEAT